MSDIDIVKLTEAVKDDTDGNFENLLFRSHPKKHLNF